MIEISVSRVGEFKSSEADVVEGLVVNAESLIGVLHKLVNRESGIVGLHNSVGHLEKAFHYFSVIDYRPDHQLLHLTSGPRAN